MIPTEARKHLWRMIIDDKSSYFEEYLSLIKTTIETKKEELNKTSAKLMKEAEGKGDDWKEQASDQLGDLSYEIDELEELMYKSFVVSVFMFIEDTTTDLCKFLKESHKCKFSYTDLSNSGIGRSFKYIKLVLIKEFPDNPTLRENFVVLQKIRNALVHADGQLKTEDLPLMNKFIKNHPGHLEVMNSGKIWVKHPFAEFILELNSDYTDEVSDNWLIEWGA